MLWIFLNWVRTNRIFENSKLQEGDLSKIHTKIILKEILMAMRVWEKEGVVWLNFDALEGLMKIELKIGRILVQRNSLD